MLFQSRYNQPLLVSELFCNHVTIVAFRIFCRLGDIFLQIDIFKKDYEQTVLGGLVVSGKIIDGSFLLCSRS